jgi:hypothetical protein
MLSYALQGSKPKPDDCSIKRRIEVSRVSGAFKHELPDSNQEISYLKLGLCALLQIDAIAAVPTAPPNFFSSRSDKPSCSV